MDAGKSSEWATEVMIVLLDALLMVRDIQTATNADRIIRRDVGKRTEAALPDRWEMILKIRYVEVEDQRLETTCPCSTTKLDQREEGRGRVKVYLSTEYPTVLMMARFLVLPRKLPMLGLLIMMILLAGRGVLHIEFF
jgi:hypothetical protein